MSHKKNHTKKLTKTKHKTTKKQLNEKTLNNSKFDCSTSHMKVVCFPVLKQNNATLSRNHMNLSVFSQRV